MAGTENNKSIVTDNLLFCLDPENYRSYIGSGTAATDISTNAIGCTLTGSVGYSAPTFTYDGAGTYIVPASTITLGTTYTLSAWVNATTLGNTVLGKTASDYFFYITATDINNDRGSDYGTWSTTFLTSTWYNVVSVRNNSTAETMYVNGVSLGDQTFTSNTSATFDEIGCDGHSSSFHWAGSQGMVWANTSVLTATQILANWNATKDKYS